jgi:endonuclease YncB( thermonuclease family)
MRKKGKTILKGKTIKGPGGVGALIIALAVFFLYVALNPDGQGSINAWDFKSLLPREITKTIKWFERITKEPKSHEPRQFEHPKPASVLRLKVIKVYDGDTIEVLKPGTNEIFKCRLYGIDAPETPKHGKPGQPYGEDSSRALEALVSGADVDIETTGERTYDREVCSVRLGNTDVNLEMIKRGYAWAYRNYLHGPYASEYIEAEEEARRARLGIWHEKNPTPPWEFRSRHKG